MIEGIISIETCAEIIKNDSLGYGAIVGILTLAMGAFIILYLMTEYDLKTYKEFLRRQNLLNKYEDWKKNR